MNILSDGQTKIYKTNKFEAIFCNTKEGNKDIYLGTPNLSSNLSGKYCGNDIQEPCQFTRTYKVISVIDDDDYNYNNWIGISVDDGVISQINETTYRLSKIKNSVLFAKKCAKKWVVNRLTIKLTFVK